MKWNSFKNTLWLLSLSTLIGGCSSGFTNVSPTPPQSFQFLGQTTGTGCGSLGLLATAYHFVPMGINGRVENAYADALSKVPGATSLTNVTIQEDWFWWLIGTARCVTLTGDAVK
ncbi:MAG: hypothetical protein Q8R95_04565 [Azonexus sp.]|nr:hypothetical protein [Azonexus sp.]